MNMILLTSQYVQKDRHHRHKTGSAFRFKYLACDDGGDDGVTMWVDLRPNTVIHNLAARPIAST